MKLFLLRHGLTEANARRLYYGKTDLPLSPEGRRLLKAAKKPPAAAAYYTSGLRRAEETLALLCPGAAHSVIPELREMDFGRFEMHSYEELKDDPAYVAWITGDNMANIPPEGESGNQMLARVLEALPELLQEDTVLVTHGGVIAAIMASLFPEEGKNRYQWQPKPGEGYAITGGTYSAIP